MPLGRVLLPLRRKTEPVTIAPGPTPRPGVLDIAPYVGGEAKIVGVERPIRLASNESALGPSAKAVAAYRALAGEIHRYPDGSAEELRTALARRHGLDHVIGDIQQRHVAILSFEIALSKDQAAQ